MGRRPVLAVALAALLAAAPAASAHQGNPNFLSQVDAIAPAGDGIAVEVLNRDDRLLLHNTSGEDVVIEGYDGEPYARVLADGTVEVNTDSQAYYLNEDRFAEVEIPEEADGKGAPRWKRISETGRFEWHDHRAHWMGKGTPPQVTDAGARTKVFGWKVPIAVGDERGSISGTLFWTPPPGDGAPTALIAGSSAVAIAICIGVIAIRRRRAGESEPAAAW
jgi:hypothetical protein